jgi:hypothetical protein
MWDATDTFTDGEVATVTGWAGPGVGAVSPSPNQQSFAVSASRLFLTSAEVDAFARLMKVSIGRGEHVSLLHGT